MASNFASDERCFFDFLAIRKQQLRVVDSCWQYLKSVNRIQNHLGGLLVACDCVSLMKLQDGSESKCVLSLLKESPFTQRIEGAVNRCVRLLSLSYLVLMITPAHTIFDSFTVFIRNLIHLQS